MAPTKRKTKTRNQRAVNVETNEKELTYESVLCPICRSILIEPVTLPCGHHFCFFCFDGTVNNAALVCPLCRTRIGSWLRQAKKDSKLVNQNLWKSIQNKFSSYVELKQNGADDSFEDDISPTPVIIATPGEIKQEYEKQKVKEEQEILKEREEEEKKSKELIIKLCEEEKCAAKLEAERLKRDEEIAKQLAAEEKEKLNETKLTPKINKKRGPMDSFILMNSCDKSKLQLPNKLSEKKNLFNISLTKNNHSQHHIFPPGLSFHDRKRYLLNDSVDYMKEVLKTETDDTIDQEITHIKPISLAPRTPPKTGMTINNSIIRTTPLRLSLDNLENIEYNRIIKSPVPNLIISPKHLSAFKSTSPYKNENNINSQNTDDITTTINTKPINKAIKRIDFDSPSQLSENQRCNISSRNSALGSPFFGFTAATTKSDCHHCKNIFNHLFNECHNNNTIHSDETIKTKLKNGVNEENHSSNSEIDTSNMDLVFDNCSDVKIKSDDIIVQQKEMEKLILQEQQDLLFAQKLHEKLNKSDQKIYELRTTRGSKNIMMNSQTTPGSSRKRQRTINELCSRKKLKIQ